MKATENISPPQNTDASTKSGTESFGNEKTPEKAVIMKKTNIADKIAQFNKTQATRTAQQPAGRGCALDNKVLNEWVRFFSIQYNKKSAKKNWDKRDGFLVVGTSWSIMTDDES